MLRILFGMQQYRCQHFNLEYVIANVTLEDYCKLVTSAL